MWYNVYHFLGPIFEYQWSQKIIFSCRANPYQHMCVCPPFIFVCPSGYVSPKYASSATSAQFVILVIICILND